MRANDKAVAKAKEIASENDPIKRRRMLGALTAQERKTVEPMVQIAFKARVKTNG